MHTLSARERFKMIPTSVGIRLQWVFLRKRSVPKAVINPGIMCSKVLDVFLLILGFFAELLTKMVPGREFLRTAE